VAAKIEIFGPTSMLTGDYPVAEIRLATSWKVEGSEFAPSFRRKIWDGRKHLFKAHTGAFPTGLLKLVTDVLTAHSVDYTVVDHRTDPFDVPVEDIPDSAFALNGVSFTGKYAYQLQAAKDMIRAKQGIVRAATNAGKTELSCATTKVLNIKTLFVVTSRELLYQARERFAKRLGLSLDDVGIIGDGHWKIGDWVTIATLDTLESRIDSKECQNFLKAVELLFIDECHHVGSETWYTVSTLCNAYYRFGLSGTPLDRTDGANLRLIAATGDIIVDIGNKRLVDLGVSARANIIFDTISEPLFKKGATYNTVYTGGVVQNDKAHAKIIDWTQICVDAGLSVLILVEEIQHGKILDEKLWTAAKTFIPHQFIYGDESVETRANALLEFKNRKLPVLIASRILDEGVDVPTIDVIICAGSRKSKIRTLQRLGRGLRGEKLIVIEFSNFCHDHLLKHSLQRYRDYKQEDCFPMYSSTPSQELIERLWNGST